MAEKLRCDSILVPIDGSAKSFEVVQYALRFGALFEHCKIKLCYVIHDAQIKQICQSHGKRFDDITKSFMEQGQKYFDKAMRDAKMRGYGENLLEGLILRGDPAEEIIKIASQYDLIIIPARGKQHIPEYMIGHVTDRVFRNASIPVLIIP